MSPTKELIDKLVEGGMDYAAAAVLVARAGVEMTGALTKKSSGAVRQQRYRDRNKASLGVTNTDEENVTSRNEPSHRYEEREPSQTVTERNEGVTRNDAPLSIEEKIESKKAKREVTRGTRLPDNWEPDRSDLEAAIALLGATRADDELEKFRDHWKGQPGSKGVKADWSATWRNWYRRANEYGNRNATGSQNRTAPSAGRATSREADFLAAMGRGALGRIEKGTSAGRDWQAPRSLGPPEGSDADGGADPPHWPAHSRVG